LNTWDIAFCLLVNVFENGENAQNVFLGLLKANCLWDSLLEIS
jgi:hypothetical protein